MTWLLCRCRASFYSRIDIRRSGGGRIPPYVARGSTVPTDAVPTLRRLFELEDLCQTTEALRTVRCDFGLKDASRLCQETHMRTNSYMFSTSNSESLSRDSHADEQVYVLFQQKAIVLVASTCEQCERRRYRPFEIM